MKKKILLYVCIISVLLNIAMIGIFATGQQEYVTATINKGIKMYWNGDLFEPVDDSDNSKLYPLIYNGRTYIPVRAVAEQSGMSVDWDNEKRAVLFGANYNAETGIAYPDSTYVEKDPFASPYIPQN
jgi:hypothetical protein